jgi:hypothetical protein
MTTATPVTTSATKKGLSGAYTVLRHEDQDEFDILLACLRDEFKPANQHESFLVEQMSQSRWRLSRARRLEAAMFDAMIESELDADQNIAAKLLAGGDRTLAAIQRYAAAAERSYYKAHSELLRSQQMRNEAKTVEHLDAAVIGRIINAPPPGLRIEPKSNRVTSQSPLNCDKSPIFKSTGPHTLKPEAR